MSTAEARISFLEQYRKVRHAEGRGSTNPIYYRELPYQDITGRNAGMWRMRARTYRFFERKLVRQWERAAKEKPLTILDLGAGNCWMAYRLSLRKHHVVALDIFSDEADGLRARRFYPLPIAAVEAEFDTLPFGANTFDAVIFNASLHYSPDYLRTLGEVQKCLRADGQIVILDSPIYARPEHGQRMVEERKSMFRKQYGFPSDAMGSIEYLDKPMLKRLGKELKLRWRVYRPWYGWRWHIRPIVAACKRKRPPSHFSILVGRLRTT